MKNGHRNCIRYTIHSDLDVLVISKNAEKVKYEDVIQRVEKIIKKN
ncbi:MAG: hypothetical protein QXL82_00345 [Candidatus Aenigmatarchaeota archaeon]